MKIKRFDLFLARILAFLGAFAAIFTLTGLQFKALAITAEPVSSPYYYNFNCDGSLKEANNPDNSESPYWWVNSGGRADFKGGEGMTIQGSLPSDDYWRITYNRTNPVDTDDGYHPQNIFRFVTRSKWETFRQEVYAYIVKDNLSRSPNRNQSNGILFFNRYKDGDNIYYAGIRVDGQAVIKKKINGRYYTMALKKFLPGTYNAKSNPNLLPKGKWIGLRTEIKTNPDNTVSVKLYWDNGKTGNWSLLVSAVDNGRSYGGAPLLEAGFAGIRTDFMDIKFDDYRNTDI